MIPAIVARSGPAERVSTFLWDYTRHTKGRWAGQPLTVEEFQRDFLDEAFEIDPHTGLRVYREVLLGIPRKNGKTSLAAGLGLYLLGWDDEDGPEVYAAAAARQQGYIVFGQAREMVGRSPILADVLRVRRYYIECPENGGIFRVLSSDAPLQHGLNPSGNVIDELHAHKNADLYVALTTGSGAREQPLTVTITTAGWDEGSILGQIHSRAMALPTMEQRSPYLSIARDRENGFLMYWYGAPMEADIDDPAVWKGTNPASWITAEYLRKQRHSPSLREDDFRRYHLNQWTTTSVSVFPAGAWARCVDPVGLDRRLPVFVGVDVAWKNDSTAIVIAQRQRDRVVVRARIWSNPYPPTHTLRAMWQTPMGEVLAELRAIRKAFPVPAGAVDGETMPGPMFLYDPAYFGGEAFMLEGDGLHMSKVDQSDARMIPASETLYRLVVEGRLAHDGDPVLASHIANVTSVTRIRGWRISKPKGSSRKIDAAIACAMAVHEAMKPPPERGVGAFLA